MGLSSNLLFSEAIDSKTATDIHPVSSPERIFFLYGLNVQKGQINLTRSFKFCQDILFAP